MSLRRHTIYQFIMEGGPGGIPFESLKEKFFKDRKPATIRTTLHYINNIIKPVRIDCRGGVVRIVPFEIIRNKY